VLLCLRPRCPSCHDSDRAFADGRSVAIGVFNRAGRRNEPALITRGWSRVFFWDGRTTTLKEQVLRPIEDPNEMDLPLDEASARVGVAVTDLSFALATYVRSIPVWRCPIRPLRQRRRDRMDPGSARVARHLSGRSHLGQQLWGSHSSADGRTARRATSDPPSPTSASTTPA